MNELKEIVEKKIQIYTSNYNISKMLDQKDNMKFFDQSIEKLKEILGIINRE